MSKIIFFSIPAYGHTNPTIEVIRELVQRGHTVWYYSFHIFQHQIEAAGAKYIECDTYLPELRSGDEKKIGKDFSALIQMTVDVTLAMESKVRKELEQIQPDCIVSDSICLWGKLYAQKLGIPCICSTTTFAMNQHTQKLMRHGFYEMLQMIAGIPAMNKQLNRLRTNGYPIKDIGSLIGNNGDIETIVYTSREFQPLSHTFPERIHFVGPSIPKQAITTEPKQRKQVYISLGTVLNKQQDFYQNCIQALQNLDVDIIMSIGEQIELSQLGNIPHNFVIEKRVAQIEVLQQTDVFLTHCGMNSVSESLYFGVPMVLFPQHGEERMVANRVQELGAGIFLEKKDAGCILASIKKILSDQSYHNNAQTISESFHKAGGAGKAATILLNAIETK